MVNWLCLYLLQPVCLYFKPALSVKCFRFDSVCVKQRDRLHSSSQCIVHRLCGPRPHQHTFDQNMPPKPAHKQSISLSSCLSELVSKRRLLCGGFSTKPHVSRERGLWKGAGAMTVDMRFSITFTRS